MKKGLECRQKKKYYFIKHHLYGHTYEFTFTGLLRNNKLFAIKLKICRHKIHNQLVVFTLRKLCLVFLLRTNYYLFI